MRENLPIRKNIRLQGYDYSQAGYYFVTICVKDKHELLWDNVGANCVRPLSEAGTNCVRPLSEAGANCVRPLSEAGIIVDNEINKISGIYETVTIDKYVVMPNHIHMVIMIGLDDGGRTQFAPTSSRVVKQFKGRITKQIGFSILAKIFSRPHHS